MDIYTEANSDSLTHLQLNDQQNELNMLHVACVFIYSKLKTKYKQIKQFYQTVVAMSIG